MEENKLYYQPDISEFHVGFRYQVFVANMWVHRIFGTQKIIRELDMSLKPKDISFDEWMKQVENDESIGTSTTVIGPSFAMIEEAIKENIIRCKFLDKEDIIECGFEPLYEDAYRKKVKLFRGRNNTLIDIIARDQHVIICCGDDETPFPDWIQIFNGWIQNYNELKKLLKQLNIE